MDGRERGVQPPSSPRNIPASRQLFEPRYGEKNDVVWEKLLGGWNRLLVRRGESENLEPRRVLGDLRLPLFDQVVGHDDQTAVAQQDLVWRSLILGLAALASKLQLRFLIGTRLSLDGFDTLAVLVVTRLSVKVEAP